MGQRSDSGFEITSHVTDCPRKPSRSALSRILFVLLRRAENRQNALNAGWTGQDRFP